MQRVMQRVLWRKLQQEWRIWKVGALPGLAVIGLVVLLRSLGLLQTLELSMLDRFLRSRPAEPLDERVLIVGIDDQDIAKMGEYPIPDQELVNLLQMIQVHQPSVIGFDLFRDHPIPKGQNLLAQAFQQHQTWIAIERAALSPEDTAIAPAPDGVSQKQVGFVNALPDSDGALRRSILSAASTNGQYLFSLTARLAEVYLKQQGYALANIGDSEAFRFGRTNIYQFRANDGGYINAVDGGNQVLINYRSGQQPFRVVSMADIQAGKVDPEWIRDRIVLVGVRSEIVQDRVNSGAIATDNPSLVYGVDVQAHAVSQIINAVLEERPLLQTLPDGGEYTWIVAWGLLGISLGRISQSPLRILVGLGVTSFILIGACYGVLLLGWWLPVAPSFMALFLNGAGLTAALFYRSGRDLQTQLKERQVVINQTFDAIHSGPLQTLSRLLRTAKVQELSSNVLLNELQQLDEELRSVWELVRRETLSQSSQLHLNSDVTIDLNTPLHETLSEVFHHTLQRDLPHFKQLKLKMPDIEPLNERSLGLEQKQMICRFVEEALCNVGKHAINATQLRLVCRQEQQDNLIQVMDNGQARSPKQLTSAKRGGTQQAEELAGLLNGQFQRRANQPTGTICELRWSIK
jgi:CHASE2 domain-containing sensor protein